METIRQEIEKKNRIFEKAVQEGHLGNLVALYTEEAVVVPPNADKYIGKAAIIPFWAGMLKELKHLKIETQELILGGESKVREIGQVTLTLETEGKQNTATSSYVVLWVVEHGEWKIDVDILF